MCLTCSLLFETFALITKMLQYKLKSEKRRAEREKWATTTAAVVQVWTLLTVIYNHVILLLCIFTQHTEIDTPTLC